MATQTQHFEAAENGVTALLNKIYEIKFSRHVPLVMILLFAVFAVWRTNHYVALQLNVGWVVSLSLAVCIELAMLAAGASCFISLREAYIKELRKEDNERAKIGVYAAFIMLGVTTLALVVLAGADGYLESNGNRIFVFLMLLIQFVQSCAIVVFINIADLEERAILRKQHVDYIRALERQKEQEHEAFIFKSVSECEWCHRPLHPNNRRRHMASCPMKPL
jgi:hypothetical protein